MTRDNEVSELSFIVEHNGRVEKFSLLYPVIYQEFYREVQKRFKLDECTRLILHYEHFDNVFRPISCVDFETLINFRIHWDDSSHSDAVLIKITVDETSPPTQSTARNNISLPYRFENEFLSQRNGYFIPEDVDDPILAPVATKRSPLSSHESDRFIQEPSDAASENDVSIEDSEWDLQGSFSIVSVCFITFAQDLKVVLNHRNILKKLSQNSWAEVDLDEFMLQSAKRRTND